MTHIDIKVAGAAARLVKQDGILTDGMVGATVTFAFDGTWDGLSKTAVFRCGSVTRDVIMSGDTVRIPPEVLRQGETLYAGVEGRSDDGSLVIPTVWARAGTVYDGANASGDPSSDPGLPVWAQILAVIGELVDLKTADKSSIVAAVNEVLSKSGGAVDEAEVQRMVEEYLAQHPLEVTESDPTVPEWAKQKTKPSYTADEVGALPDTYTPPAAPVQSVNGKTGAVNLTAEDVGALPDDTQIPTVPDWVKSIAAEVGQYFRVSAVDENGNVSAVEAVDMASGSGEEAPFASVTMTGSTYPVLAYADNVITIEPTDLDGKWVILRKADHSGGLTIRLVATDTPGQYTIYNRDGGVGIASYTSIIPDPSVCVVEVRDADNLTVSGLSGSEYLKIRITAPLCVSHGSRTTYMLDYPTSLEIDHSYVGKAFEGIVETKAYDVIDGKM